MPEFLRYDIRLAIRSLLREPAHSLVAVLILAIGIGANTAVFSVVNPLLLKPLPFRDADRLVWIENTGGPGLSEQTYRVAAYEELARQSRSFDAMSGYFAFFGYMSYTLTGTGVPERLSGVPIAPGFLEMPRRRPRARARILERGVDRGRPRRRAPERRSLAPPLRRRPGHRRPDCHHQRRPVGGRRRPARPASISRPRSRQASGWICWCRRDSI